MEHITELMISLFWTNCARQPFFKTALTEAKAPVKAILQADVAVDEKLKAKNTLMRIRKMNNCISTAEETVL